MSLSIIETGGIMFLFRWIHFMSGVVWIGTLYYFNFMQGSFFATTDATTKSNMIRGLVPNALWWFRWGAMFTFLSGLAMLEMTRRSGMTFGTSWGVLILTGATLGTFMWANVWFIIWPNQKIVIASAEQVAKGGSPLPAAAAAATRAGIASRHNVLFSIPMLFFMGGASHLGILISESANLGVLAGVLAVIIGGLELNAIKGKMGPLTKVSGVIHSGLALTVVLYLIIEFLTK